MYRAESVMVRLLAQIPGQIPGVPDDIGDFVNTAEVTPWDGVGDHDVFKRP